MKILIRPSDILEKSLWDNYVYYVVSSEKAETLLKKKIRSSEISERDALIIGLLKVMKQII